MERAAVFKQLLALAELRYKERKRLGWMRRFIIVHTFDRD